MEPKETRYIYVLVRKDLSPSQQAVQACHVAIEASRTFLDPEEIHPHLVLLEISDKMTLSKVAIKLYLTTNIAYRVFLEEDIGNEPTALATEPIYGEDRTIFKDFKLLDLGEQ